MDSNTASLSALTSLLDTTAHAYAYPQGDAAIRAASELALKDVFNLGQYASSEPSRHERRA
jgi:hypothetical protein